MFGIRFVCGTMPQARRLIVIDIVADRVVELVDLQKIQYLASGPCQWGPGVGV